MELVLVRHGATDDNAAGRITGQQDPPLSEQGIKQAQRAGAVLWERGIDAAYSSDLERAHRTAAIIVGPDGQGVVTDPAFREQDFGRFEGGSKEAWRRWEQEQDADRWGLRPPGGESMREAADRFIDGMGALVDTHDGERVLIGAHGVVLRAVLMRVMGLGSDWYRRLSIENTGITELYWDDHWCVRSINETGHLDRTRM